MEWNVDIATPMNQLTKGSEGYLQAALHDIVDAIEVRVCGLDAQGSATFCNDALRKMTGYRAEQIVGQNVHELLNPSHGDGSLNPSEESSFRNAIDTHQAIHVRDQFLLRKDKSRFPAEYWVRPLPQPSGDTWYVVTVKDTSDVHQAMEADRQSRERFRRILASAPDVAWTSDPHG